jgi:hypothetical protein
MPGGQPDNEKNILFTLSFAVPDSRSLNAAYLLSESVRILPEAL